MQKNRVRSGLFHHGGDETVVSMGDVSFGRATGPAATPSHIDIGPIYIGDTLAFSAAGLRIAGSLPKEDYSDV
jgi:hypothetical protein